LPGVLEVAARLVLGGVLAGASLAKLASPSSSRAALASFGIEGRRAQSLAFPLLIGAELVLAVGVIAGLDVAAALAAARMGLFAATMVTAILRGNAGAPCACFGARSTVGWPAVIRNAALAAAFAALPLLPEDELSTDEWLALGLAVALVACAGLAVAVLALAREVGMPIASLARDPIVAVASFEEHADADVWKRLEIPGSPFAIALARDGTVLAKGTFNNLAQLETVLGAAERRQAEREVAGAVGV